MGCPGFQASSPEIDLIPQTDVVVRKTETRIARFPNSDQHVWQETNPGIAGIVLTVGMAVDANVLIFERIREELRNGNSPQASIHSGYEKALSTIADANVTTLIAAIVLFAFGTGPIKGFAITLSVGIVTSMFTSIIGTRALVNLIYGGRRLERLPI